MSEQWDALSEAIEVTLPPIASHLNKSRMESILSSLLSGDLKCWTVWDGDEPIVVSTIGVVTDTFSMTKNLLIYSLYSYPTRRVPDTLWWALFRALRKTAEDWGCKKIVAFTDVARIVSLAKILGGDVNTTFIQLEV